MPFIPLVQSAKLICRSTPRTGRAGQRARTSTTTRTSGGTTPIRSSTTWRRREAERLDQPPCVRGGRERAPPCDRNGARSCMTGDVQRSVRARRLSITRGESFVRTSLLSWSATLTVSSIAACGQAARTSTRRGTARRPKSFPVPRDVILHTHNVQKYSRVWLDAFLNERFLDVVGAILGPDIILHHSKLFQKPSGARLSLSDAPGLAVFPDRAGQHDRWRHPRFDARQMKWDASGSIPAATSLGRDRRRRRAFQKVDRCSIASRSPELP